MLTSLASILRAPVRRLLAGLLGLALWMGQPLAMAAPQNPISGVRFDAQAQLGGQALQLNGTGLRAVAWLKGYAAGLYLAQPAGSTEAVLAQAGAKRLQMRMLVEVPTGEFIKAFHKGVERNTPVAEQPALADRMARFDALIQPLGKVRKGDLVNLDLVPGLGMQLSLNGKPLGAAIPGDDFYVALLRIFLGDKPVDDRLKAGLLGRRT